MAIDTMVAKTIFAFVFALILIWVVRPAIAVIGMTTCPNCSPFITVMMFVVVPVGAVFIGIYQVFSIFTRSST